MDPDLSSIPPGGTLVLRVIKRPPDPPLEEEDEEQQNYYEDEGGEYAEDEEFEGEYREEEESTDKAAENQGPEGETYGEEDAAPEAEGEAEGVQVEQEADLPPPEVHYEIAEEIVESPALFSAEEGSPAEKFRNKKVICTLCNTTFENYYMHFAHQKEEHKPVTCGTCKRVFNGTNKLYQHCEAEHADKDHFTCVSCRVTFTTRENLERHERTHKEDAVNLVNRQLLKCERCQYICASESLLSRHIHTEHRSVHEPTEYKPYLCRICGARFRYDFTYDAHLKSHETDEFEEYAHYERREDVEAAEWNEASRAAKRIKMDTDPESETPSEGQIATEESVTESPLMVKNEENSQQFELDKDQLVMTTSKPFQCHKCSESFRWKVSLQVHMKLHEQPTVPIPARSLGAEQFVHKVLPQGPLPVGANRTGINSFPPIYVIKSQPKTGAETLQDRINRIASQRQVIYRPPENVHPQQGETVILENGQGSSAKSVPVHLVENRAYSVQDGNAAEQEVIYTTLEEGATDPGTATEHSFVVDQSMIDNAEGPLYIQGPDGQLLELRPSESQAVTHSEDVLLENGIAAVQQEAVQQEVLQAEAPSTYTVEEQVNPPIKLEAAENGMHAQGNGQYMEDGNVLVTEGEPSEQMVVVPPPETNQGEMIMTSLRLQNETWCASLCATLADMQQQQAMCNVTLVGSDNQSVIAHACLIAAASPCLKGLLTGVKKGAHSVLKFDTIPSDLWQLLIMFVYSGKVEVPIASVSSIMVAATHLQIEGLATLCADLLKQYDAGDNIIVQLQIEDWSVHICSVLHQFWQLGTMCDTTLTTSDGAKAVTIACVLAAASPTFRSILSSMKQGIYNIRTDQITKESWDYLFQFMFTGECEVPVGKDLVALYQATEQLNIAPLKALCADCISSLGSEPLTS